MSWWEHLVGPVTGLVLSVCVGVGFRVWRRWRARRSLPAVRAGRAVRVPVTVDSERVSRGGAVRDGADLRVVTGRFHLLLDSHEAGLSSTRRSRADGEAQEVAELRGYRDPAGRTFLVGPPREWAQVLDAMLAQPARPAGWVLRLRAGMPRSASAIAVTALLGLGVFQTIWWSGHDVTGRMVGVVQDRDASYCAVQWRDGGSARRAELDCDDPPPALGTPVRARALTWPLDGNAMDYVDTFWPVTGIGVVGFIATVAAGAVVAGFRLRRTPTRLRAVLAQGARTPPTDTAGQPSTLREVARAVARLEDWDHDAVDEAPIVRPWTPLLMAVSAGHWWPIFLLLVVAWGPASMPRPWSLALSAGAVVVAIWASIRAVTAFSALRRAMTEPVTSEWDYQLVRGVDDVWLALLWLGDAPPWAVVLGSDLHPRSEGRCGVRGDLRDGGAVQLRIGDSFWMGRSPVFRMEPEDLEDLREDLAERLSGRPTVSP